MIIPFPGQVEPRERRLKALRDLLLFAMEEARELGVREPVHYMSTAREALQAEIDGAGQCSHPTQATA